MKSIYIQICLVPLATLFFSFAGANFVPTPCPDDIPPPSPCTPKVTNGKITEHEFDCSAADSENPISFGYCNCGVGIIDIHADNGYLYCERSGKPTQTIWCLVNGDKGKFEEQESFDYSCQSSDTT